MYQNAYCSHKASGIERKSISFKRTHISTTLLTTFSVLFHSDSICATRRVCTNLSTYIFKLNSEPQKTNINEHRASLGGSFNCHLDFLTHHSQLNVYKTKIKKMCVDTMGVHPMKAFQKTFELMDRVRTVNSKVGQVAAALEGSPIADILRHPREPGEQCYNRLCSVVSATSPPPCHVGNNFKSVCTRQRNRWVCLWQIFDTELSAAIPLFEWK